MPLRMQSYFACHRQADETVVPERLQNDVTLNNLVLSVDPDCSPELTAMLGSAIATAISDIPFGRTDFHYTGWYD